MLAQLSEEEWNKLIKDVLSDWYDPPKLDQHPLANMGVVGRYAQDSFSHDPLKRAKALRHVFRLAIEALGVDGEAPPRRDDLSDPLWAERRWRYRNILTLLSRGETTSEIKRQVLVLGGHYYEEQAKAIGMLAEVLRAMEGIPNSAAPTKDLSYPSGAVKPDDPYYVERKADADLIAALQRPGETITIRGPRQVGKTSLLARGIHHAGRQLKMRLVYLDMQGVGEETTASLDTFLKFLAVLICARLGLDISVVEKAWDSILPPMNKLTGLVEDYILANAEHPVLLAMDEIDQLQFKEYSFEFFAFLRSWHNNRAMEPVWNNLSIMMAISTEPYLLIDSLNQSPFNVGEVLQIGDFDQSQTANLNYQYGSPVSPNDLPRMMTLLRGQPYLTRVALYTMVISKLSWSELEKVSTSDQGPFHQHLQLQYRLLLQDQRLKDAFREIIRTNRCKDEGAGFRLMKAGLTRSLDDGGYECRCDLYRRYFSKVF